MKQLPFDELHLLEEALGKKQTISKEEAEDLILDILILAYLNGIERANEQLGSSYKPDEQHVMDVIFREIDGEDFSDRLNKPVFISSVVPPNDDEQGVSSEAPGPSSPGEVIYDIMRIAETEAHRVFNTAIGDVAEDYDGTVYKTWRSQEDLRVRDTHDYLDGTTVPYDEDFYSYTGSHGPYPGAFDDPKEDINCRCFIDLSTE